MDLKSPTASKPERRNTGIKLEQMLLINYVNIMLNI